MIRHISITPEHFQALIAGGKIEFMQHGVAIQIVLADIGYRPMLEAIAGQAKASGFSTAELLHALEGQMLGEGHFEPVFETRKVRPRRGRMRDAVDATHIGCSCGCELFRTFQVTGTDHPHLQCANCFTTYCPHGRCGQEG